MNLHPAEKMSSGFVSGGTTDNPVLRDDEWLKAQQEVEENHRRKEQEGVQDGGKTLYEILQNNKGERRSAKIKHLLCWEKGLLKVCVFVV